MVRGSYSQEGLDRVLQHGFRALADVGRGWFITALGNGLVSADVGASTVAISGDGNKVPRPSLLGEKLEIQHGFARQM